MIATGGPLGPRGGGTGLRGPVAATVLLFVANGAIFGAIVPRLPDLKSALDLGPAGFGLAMACFPAGALVGGLLAPALMRRRSDGAVAVAAMVLTSLAAALLALSPVVGAFAGLLLVFGVCDAVTDVAMNAHGIRVQLRHGRSLINRFHAVWSLGAVLGATGGSFAAGIGASVVVQMSAAGVACALAALAAHPLRLRAAGSSGERRAPQRRVSRDPVPQRQSPQRRLPGGRTLLLLVAFGLLASSAAVVEDFAQTWSALYLREVAVAGAGVAGFGFIAVQGAQLIGRLAGDRLVDGIGAAHVGRTGGMCVVAGAGAALVGSFVLDGPALLTVVLAGFALAGWGIATVIPGAMVGADSVPGLSPGTGLAVLNWVMRLGFLTAPPLVGLIAEHAGMRWTVAPVLVGGVVIVLLAGRLLGRERASRAREVRA
ncbi:MULTISPECIES: MFS transporter [Dietzia]|uniref:MFS transporter n=1 Tax=Dietzia natronolimnaea TaxID=161920 RepID=A0A2A2WQB1_9ACTN|nr:MULTISPECIES: MFS transporter [Dietzia]AVZ40510.1 MFS transporter [Dietzia sp. JS16-p6b]PAY23378.1 MFS transporter [Dietzia natronolimnaea]QGW26041.1 major facilitator family transporter [Dietzia sp. DQ12-45-1b]